MIKPTVGRVVWFWESKRERDEGGQPQSAQIAYVNSDFNVNLSVTDRWGNVCGGGRTSVPLFQGEEHGSIPTSGPFCEWMPFQKGQARAQTEQEKLQAEHSIVS